MILPEKELFRVNNIFTHHEYAILRRFLPSGPLTVVDMGANVGLFAIYMQMTQTIDAIHCFEPAPASVKLLKDNVGDLEAVHIHPF